MEASCVVIELKPNSRSRVQEWANFILANKDEACATLENEGVTLESFFLVEIESKDYLVGYMRAKSLKEAHEVVKTSLSEIDAYHKQFQQDCWVKGLKAEPVLELNRLDAEEPSR